MLDPGYWIYIGYSEGGGFRKTLIKVMTTYKSRLQWSLEATLYWGRVCAFVRASYIAILLFPPFLPLGGGHRGGTGGAMLKFSV